MPGSGGACRREFRARSAAAPIPATPASLEARIAASPLAHLGAVEATARAAPAAHLRHALIIGACGPTGETLLTQLLGGDAYQRVTAVTRLPLPSSTRKLLPHLHAGPDLRALTGLPAADDAYLVIGEQYSFYRRDEAFHAMSFDALLQTARAVRAGGTRRLAVVAPAAIYSHSSAFRRSLMNATEYDLFALDFETLALVRPAAPEKFMRHRNWGKRLASFLLRQVHGLMPEAYHPPTSKEVAAVAARVLHGAQRGVVIVDADQVRNQHKIEAASENAE